MEKETRLKIILSKHAHAVASSYKPQGMHAASNEAQQRRRQRSVRPVKCAVFDLSTKTCWPSLSTKRPDWAAAPDEAEREELRIKRGFKPHHLTVIAEKWLHASKRKAKVTP